MSNEDDFVDIEELEDNNPKGNNEENNIQTTQDKNKIEENNNFDFNDDNVKLEEEDKNKECNNIDDDKNNTFDNIIKLPYLYLKNTILIEFKGIYMIVKR
jgi:hypothetical protein